MKIKMRKMKFWEKAMVSGALVFMLAVNSLTAFACPDAHQAEENTAAAAEEQEAPVIFYDDQFVDEEGNVTPVNGYMPRVWCLGHEIVSGYFQNHVRNDNGGCTIKTYYSTRCIYCNTIWLGDLHSKLTYTKCPH